MASLKDLTVPLIDKLAKECNISFKKGEKKADKIAIIESSNIDKTQLDFLLQKYLAIKKTKKKNEKRYYFRVKRKNKVTRRKSKVFNV